MKWQEAISSEYLNLMKEQTLFETTTIFTSFMNRDNICIFYGRLMRNFMQYRKRSRPSTIYRRFDFYIKWFKPD